MLTKSELVKKKSVSSDQLDLVETISADDNAQKKRKLLYISLFFTIGLSLIFWGFNQVKNILNSPLTLPDIKSFSLPVASSSSPDLNSLFESTVTSVVGNNTGWNVSVFIPSSDFATRFNWSKNTQSADFDTVYQQLSSQKKSINSLIAPFLPQGLEIKENYSENGSSFSLSSLITTPKKEILIIINADLSTKSKDILSLLVSSLYWSAIQN